MANRNRNANRGRGSSSTTNNTNNYTSTTHNQTRNVSNRLRMRNEIGSSRSVFGSSSAYNIDTGGGDLEIGTKDDGMGFSDMFEAGENVQKLWDGANKLADKGIARAGSRSTIEELAGSKEAGDQLYGQIGNMRKGTTLGQAVYGNAATLMRSGAKASEVMPDLKMLGDVSGGKSESMSKLTEAYGNTRTSGKLGSEDRDKMKEAAGFDPLTEIAKNTGRSITELTVDMEAGKISFDMVKGALQSATAEGGRFHGKLAASSENPAGHLEATRANMEDSVGQIGEAMMPVMDRMSGFLQDNILSKAPGWIEELSPVMEQLIGRIEELWPSIEAVGKSLFGALKPIIDVVLGDSMMSALKNVMGLIKVVLDDLKPIMKIVGDVLNIALDAVSWIAKKLTGWFGGSSDDEVPKSSGIVTGGTQQDLSMFGLGGGISQPGGAVLVPLPVGGRLPGPVGMQANVKNEYGISTHVANPADSKDKHTEQQKKKVDASSTAQSNAIHHNGPRQVVINVNKSFVEQFTIHTQQVTQGYDQLKNMVGQAFLEILNSAASVG